MKRTVSVIALAAFLLAIIAGAFNTSAQATEIPAPDPAITEAHIYKVYVADLLKEWQSDQAGPVYPWPNPEK